MMITKELCSITKRTVNETLALTDKNLITIIKKLPPIHVTNKLFFCYFPVLVRTASLNYELVFFYLVHGYILYVVLRLINT